MTTNPRKRLYQSNNSPTKKHVSRLPTKRCPYLGTIDRTRLDFDLSNMCSITLSKTNVYCCLICGVNFQGRRERTPAYIHSIETNHHLFLDLKKRTVYCLPDGYQVIDKSFDDIISNLHPTYTEKQLPVLNQNSITKMSIDKKEFIPGFVGLDCIDDTDWINVSLQLLSQSKPVRNWYLTNKNTEAIQSTLVRSFGQTLRKMWNKDNFKGIVSPFEFVHQVFNRGNTLWKPSVWSDPFIFLSWLLNTLKKDVLVFNKKKKTVTEPLSTAFVGKLKILIEKIDLHDDLNEKKEKQGNQQTGTQKIEVINSKGSGPRIITLKNSSEPKNLVDSKDQTMELEIENEKGKEQKKKINLKNIEKEMEKALNKKQNKNENENDNDNDNENENENEKEKEKKKKIIQIESNYDIEKNKNIKYVDQQFFFLSLDLPVKPLFKKSLEKNLIPQVPIYTLLNKYNGNDYQELPIKKERRKYFIVKHPKYLLVHIRRFVKHIWGIEKNNTLVNCPLKDLHLEDCIHPNSYYTNPQDNLNKNSKKKKKEIKYNLIANICHDGQEAGKGNFFIFLYNKTEDQWLKIQNLDVAVVKPQEVSVSESYIQLYELQNN
ncbi:hypothetical protein M0813_13787 [Anaeramoeba flamelloides]|uniref:U4/U6.U5 tri-snRNP-associated protein 2 n=1 Tax=Anaeramoeba flamelloides TaxID=1746091 RepID=A0ABQ8Z7X8_9EUKA|nr:hypothetical protein M0813_13787 [Anaeramoeba flamelloides]